jgi:hypothetical protein
MTSETPQDFAAEAQRQMREYAAALADYPHLVEVVGPFDPFLQFQRNSDTIITIMKLQA